MHHDDALVDNTNTRHRGGLAAQAVGRQEELRVHRHASLLDNTKHRHAEVRPRPAGGASKHAPAVRCCGSRVRPSRLSPSGFAPQDEGGGVRGSARMKTPPHAEKLVTPAMVVVGLVLATVPLWITRVGLYPYLGVEILIWSLYALAFNLLLGTAGLPSFGHGAYFGVGAYAFGLFQLKVAANLWLCLGAALLAAAVAGAVVSLFISHRRGIYY